MLLLLLLELGCGDNMSRGPLVIVATLYHASCCAAWQVCNVMDYGAAGDGHTLDTSAIVSALQACSAGGTVWLPRGKPGDITTLRFLSSPFNLSSNIELRVDATLLATTDAALWPVLPKLPSFPDGVENSPGMSGRYAAFIGGEHMVNVTISGEGTIDGQGLVWWQRSGRLPGHKKTILHTRGRLVSICQSVSSLPCGCRTCSVSHHVAFACAVVRVYVQFMC